jgi:hypothetical protein
LYKLGFWGQQYLLWWVCGGMCAVAFVHLPS